MGTKVDYARLIDSAPRVNCERCHVEMTLRTLLPASNSDRYFAALRCPKCGMDVQRDFRFNQAASGK